MEIAQKIERVKNTIIFRMNKFDREARQIGKKLVGREREIIRTRLELNVCKELDLDYGTFCSEVAAF